MAKIRSIRPQLYEHEGYGTASLHARQLLLGIITQADDDGRLRAAAPLLRGQVFPYDDVALATIDNAMGELAEAGLVRAYGHNGHRYAEVLGWRDPDSVTYQQIRADRYTPSKLPPPSSTNPVIKPADLQGKTPSGQPSDNQATTKRPTGIGIGRGSGEGKEDPLSETGKPASDGVPPKRSKPTAAEIRAAIDKHRETIGEPAAKVEELIDLYAEGNKTGKVAESRMLREVWNRIAAKVADGLDREALAYGLDEAIRRGIASAGYALSAANGYQPTYTRQTPPPDEGNRRANYDEGAVHV